MNCLQFENVLSDYLEGQGTSEQRAHLSSCSACSDLLADLSLISAEASSLRELDGPSDKLWNSIEAQLRRGGVINEPAFPSPHEFFYHSRGEGVNPVGWGLCISPGVKT